ncbi:unnamed protein product [Larinioides sclopetarius]|uniref:Amidase domain-containing protein n=1 Tax=Larinioides sclopetarius TaxID=280406 RepID=A0AAV1YPK5_9ARAC
MTSSLWWTGPTWLSQPVQSWPMQSLPILPNGIGDEEAFSSERRKAAIVNTMTTTISGESCISGCIDIDKYSTLEKLLRVTAWVRRFVYNAKADSLKLSGPLCASELQEALYSWIKATQLKHFELEVKQLLSKGIISKNSSIYSLNPELDDNQILQWRKCFDWCSWFCSWAGKRLVREPSGLVSNLGCFPAPDSNVADFLYTGPMCRYAEDLVLSMRILSADSGKLVDISEKVNFKTLKIRFMKEIHGLLVVPVREEMVQALKCAVSYFQTYYSVESKEVKMPTLYDASRAVLCTLLDGVSDLKATLTNGMEDFNEKLDYLKCFFGKSTLSYAPLRAMNGAKVSLLCNKNNASKYQKLIESWSEEFDHLLDDHTVLLMPTFPVTAPYHSEIFHFLPSSCYTSIFNVLGLPSTQCPLGYTSDGLPYGIQIVGRKNSDALTIACAVELEKFFGGWKSPGSL